MGIIVTSNRFLNIYNLDVKFSNDHPIEQHTLEAYVNNFCTKLNHTNYENEVCVNCLLDGEKEYEGWCSCNLLIYLNKTIIDIWRYLEEDD